MQSKRNLNRLSSLLALLSCGVLALATVLAPSSWASETKSKQEKEAEKPLTEVEKDLQQAAQWRNQEKFADALALLEKSMKKEGRTPEEAAWLLYDSGIIRFAQARASFIKGQPRDDNLLRRALADFTSVRERYPNSPRAAEATYMTASTHLTLRQNDLALQFYQDTYKNYPNYIGRARALLRSGILMTGLERTREARTIYQQVAREFPDRERDRKQALKYVTLLDIIGRPYAPLRAQRWIHQSIDRELGLRTVEGEVVMLLFMGTWCTSCSKSLPMLRNLVDAAMEKGVVCLGIFNPNDRRATVSPDVYLEKAKLDLFDVGLVAHQPVLDFYHADVLPAMVLIDRKGTVRWRGHPTYFPLKLMEKLLGEL